MARNRDDDTAVRITTAAANRNEEIALRQKRYLFSMSLRSICFVGAIIAFLLHLAWVWPFLIAGALLLPYVAVVMANARHTGGDGFALRDSENSNRQLGSGTNTGRGIG